jgi:hypothetical protein
MEIRRGTCFQKGIKLLSDERKFARSIHRVSAGRSEDRGFTRTGLDRNSGQSTAGRGLNETPCEGYYRLRRYALGDTPNRDRNAAVR